MPSYFVSLSLSSGAPTQSRGICIEHSQFAKQKGLIVIASGAKQSAITVSKKDFD
jgi:hypothetical protein